MSKGPEQLKFEQAVGEKGSSKSHSADLLLAKQRWHLTAKVLNDNADDLELRAYSAPAVSDQTGQAMQDAFLKTASSMRERAQKLNQGADALGDAATTLHAAEQAKSQLRELHDPGAWTGGTPVTDKELTAKSSYDTALSTYNADKKHNETVAAQHNQAMDQQNEQSTEVMKKVYGYQDPTPDAGTYGGGTAKTPGTPGSSTSAPPSGGTTTHGGTDTGGTPTGGGTHHTIGGHDTGTPTGTPQGDIGAPAADAGAIGGSGFTPTTPTQTTPGSVGSSFGGVGATIGAGLAGGAGGMFSGVRGGSALPTSGSSAAGARSIGSSSRSGGASTLGRAAATRAGAMSAEEEAALQRNGAAGRGAGAGSGGTAGRTGGRGSPGRSGTSGRSGRNGGTGGQGGRGRKKGATAELDHMIIEEDWLDDEGQSPAVID
jgi:hypothetical protein